MRRYLALLLVGIAVVGFATWLSGEVNEVAVLRTFDASGVPHDTKLWVIEVGGAPWVRVAHPNRDWYQRLLTEPRVELVRGGHSEPRVARPSHDDTVRRAVDEAFAAKYGPVDVLYGVLVRRDAVPIRLEPIGEEVETVPEVGGAPRAAAGPSRATP